jgi:hypothetical protein
VGPTRGTCLLLCPAAPGGASCGTRMLTGFASTRCCPLCAGKQLPPAACLS